MSPLQRDLHQQLQTEAASLHDRIATLTRPLDPEQLVRRPALNAWSVAEVLEHLCVADELHGKPVNMLIHRAHIDAGAPFREWRPSLLGKLIAGRLANPKPLRAARAMRPGPTPRNAVVEDFLTRDSRFRQRMDDALNLDWRDLRLHPPMLPPVLKYNLGDVFSIRVVHVRRHFAQLERLTGQLQ